MRDWVARPYQVSGTAFNTKRANLALQLHQNGLTIGIAASQVRIGGIWAFSECAFNARKYSLRA